MVQPSKAKIERFIPLEKPIVLTQVTVKKLVDAGEAPRADAFIEASVVESLRKRRLDVVHASYARAAADPGFMADIHATMSAFDATLLDGRKAE